MEILKRELAYSGIDFWSRPTFIDAHGNIFGNMDILFDGNASYQEVREKISEDNIYFFGINIDDDPMGTKIDPNKIILVEKFSKQKG